METMVYIHTCCRYAIKVFLTFYKIKLNLKKKLNVEKFFVVDSFIFSVSMFGAKVHLNGSVLNSVLCSR